MLLEQKRVSLFFLGIFFLNILVGCVSATVPSPLREYLFNETGDKTYSTYNGAYLELTKNKGETPFDLHSEPGAGVSGTLEDRAFDNSLAEKMGGNSYGFAVEPNYDNELKELKSFTVQTWLYAHQDGVITGRGNAARLVYNGNTFDIFFESFGLTCKINGGLYRSTKNIYYGKKWVFLAVTFDNISKKVRFYVGDKENKVTFLNEVPTTTSPGKDTHKLSIGDIYIGGDRAFKGLIDNFRIYGSKIDASGALELDQLESLRLADITRSF